jgi:AcrR family transcriptional regulator
MNPNKQNKVYTPRDRSATRARLIEAVGTILARDGFTALGVNAVARSAGVDKVLIYRYFGGLPGLMEAFGQEGNFWPTIEELADGDVEAFARLPMDEKLRRLARNFIHGIQTRPLTQEIMAWEMVERNELTIALEVIRENRMLQFYEMFFSTPTERVDLVAISAIIGAAISYLVTRSRKIQWYGGVDLQSSAGWERLLIAVDRIIGSVLDLDKE